MKNKLFVFVAVIMAIAVLIAFQFLPKPDAEVTSSQPDQKQTASFSRAHSPSFGTMLARVTVVEWFDPECESCRMIHGDFKKVIQDYKDRVRFVMRYMPYHKGSMYASSVLQEAHEFGKFEEVLEILFLNQPEWGSHQSPKPELIPTYLTSVGIPAEKLQKEYVLSKHQKNVELDQADGNQLGVTGTPTFFVNGVMVEELRIEKIREAIDRALNSKPM